MFYAALAFLSVFGWGIADAIVEFHHDEDSEKGFMVKYTHKNARGFVFGIANYLWLGFRFMSITFFANALCRFWSVFKEVKEESVGENQ